MRKLLPEEMNRLSVGEFKGAPKKSIVVILDNVRSQHNIGSVFRTCDAFGIEKILLCGITATPPNREIQKTALGATESVIWQYIEDTCDAVRQMKNEGYVICAIEQVENSTFLEDFHTGSNEKLAVVFGNEVNGVDEKVLPLVDHCIEIRQFGTKHSMNVSITAGIVLWELCKVLTINKS